MAEWDDWRHQLLVGCHRQPDLPKAMKDVMRQAGVSTDVKDITLDPDVKRRFSLTLYRQLSLLTTGEALTVVRSVEDKFADQCGFGALALLSQRFNPKTPARALQQWASVLDPPRVKDVRLLQRTIEEWESRRGKLKSEFGEDVSDNLSIAILTRMLPRDIQDMVYQLGRAGEKLVYQDVRDKVMGIASNRSHELMPTPMDVGCMEGGRADGGAEWQGQNDQEIDAIRGQCYNCQGWGHAAHECPSKPVKGKGKAKGDSSKGSGKGVSSGKGGGGKSGGKGGGYQGKCFRCGQIGHKAAECDLSRQKINDIAAASAQTAGQAETVEVADVGGVWAISRVEREAPAQTTREEAADGLLDWTRVKSRWRSAGARPTKKSEAIADKGVAISGGRFAWLCQVEAEIDSATSDSLTTEITVDSAADESVCPERWAEQFKLNPVENGKEMRFVNASGGRIQHLGSRRVAMHAAEGGKTLEMGFQVTNVRKPLLAVSRLCEKGNVVQFGPEPQHNFIRNITTGEKIHLQRRGNSWVLSGELAAGMHF